MTEQGSIDPSNHIDMKRYLHLLLLCGALLSGIFGANSIASVVSGGTESAYRITRTDHYGQQQNRDFLWNTNEQGRSQAACGLIDNHHPLRICSAGIERLPLPAWKSGRWMARLQCINDYKQYYSFLQRRPGHEATPYDCCAPCEYYVIALRHILC